jgi:hypothetical protein
MQVECRGFIVSFDGYKHESEVSEIDERRGGGEGEDAPLQISRTRPCEAGDNVSQLSMSNSRLSFLPVSAIIFVC